MFAYGLAMLDGHPAGGVDVDANHKASRAAAKFDPPQGDPVGEAGGLGQRGDMGAQGSGVHGHGAVEKKRRWTETGPTLIGSPRGRGRIHEVWSG